MLIEELFDTRGPVRRQVINDAMHLEPRWHGRFKTPDELHEVDGLDRVGRLDPHGAVRTVKRGEQPGDTVTFVFELLACRRPMTIIIG